MQHTNPQIYSSSFTGIAVWALVVGCVLSGSFGNAGEMYRWVDEQGRIQLTDTPPYSKRDLQDLKVYRSSETPLPSESSGTPSAEAGRAKLTPMKPAGAIVVQAVLNRRLTVPLVLDTGAAVTVLTKQVAEELGIPSLDHLPKRPFGTAGGMVNFPITSLRSLRVGTAEARDVNVAIDIDGHMPMGLLGMTFLRHFKMTIDQQSGQASFER